MRTVLHHVAPVHHQPTPVLRNRADAIAHPPEDAFDAGRPEVQEAECVTAAVTIKTRRDAR